MPIRRARCGRCQAKSADNTLCIIEYFGNADAVPQPSERCLSRKAGIVRCCRKFIIQAIAIKIQSIPVFWCRIFAEHAWQQSLKTGNFFARFYFPLFSAYRGTFLGKKTSCTDWGANQYRKFIVLDIGQHRTIPALRLKHRSGGCGTASALPKCSIIHKVLSALLA